MNDKIDSILQHQDKENNHDIFKLIFRIKNQKKRKNHHKEKLNLATINFKIIKTTKVTH